MIEGIRKEELAFPLMGVVLTAAVWWLWLEILLQLGHPIWQRFLSGLIVTTPLAYILIVKQLPLDRSPE